LLSCTVPPARLDLRGIVAVALRQPHAHVVLLAAFLVPCHLLAADEQPDRRTQLRRADAQVRGPLAIDGE
jgi:hypothetical protein